MKLDTTKSDLRANLRSVYDFVLANNGSADDALLAVAMWSSATRDGRIERTPASHITQAVCERFDVTPLELVGKSRLKHIALARQVAAWWLRVSGYSLRETAGLLGCGAPNVVKAVRAVERINEKLAAADEVAELLRRRMGDPSRKLPVLFPRSNAG
jgi:chromosomal replication initiation ATPase DnaA